jgi:hypothetical protein
MDEDKPRKTEAQWTGGERETLSLPLGALSGAGPYPPDAAASNFFGRRSPISH